MELAGEVAPDARHIFYEDGISLRSPPRMTASVMAQFDAVLASAGFGGAPNCLELDTPATRLPKVPDAPYIMLAPDWVCEVLSPSSTRIDRFEKRTIYTREAVKYLWIVDPRVRAVASISSGGPGSSRGGASCC